MAKKPMWQINAESLEKMYPNSPTNFKEILREYQPLWKNPQTQRAAMKLEYLLKKKKWEPANRRAKAQKNLEALLRTPQPRHDAKRSIPAMVADWLTILTNALRR